MWHRFTNAVLQPEFQAWFRPVVPNLFRLVYHQLNSALPGVSLSLKYPLVHFTILPVWSTQVGPEVLVPLLGNHWFRRSWATESWCAVRERFVIFELLFLLTRVMIGFCEWLVHVSPLFHLLVAISPTAGFDTPPWLRGRVVVSSTRSPVQCSHVSSMETMAKAKQTLLVVCW